MTEWRGQAHTVQTVYFGRGRHSGKEHKTPEAALQSSTRVCRTGSALLAWTKGLRRSQSATHSSDLAVAAGAPVRETHVMSAAGDASVPALCDYWRVEVSLVRGPWVWLRLQGREVAARGLRKSETANHQSPNAPRDPQTVLPISR
jgi:hypothetical protein